MKIIFELRPDWVTEEEISASVGVDWLVENVMEPLIERGRIPGERCAAGEVRTDEWCDCRFKWSVGMNIESEKTT